MSHLDGEVLSVLFFFFSSRRRHTRFDCDWSSDVCSSDLQAVIVLDNGTGAITGQALQGRTDLEGLWRAVLAPVARLGADSVANRNKTGTDHLSFLPYGVPGFNFNQLERGYGHTHHSQSDTYDMAIAADLKQPAAVMAVSRHALASPPRLLSSAES